jgi:hypothetical protein
MFKKDHKNPTIIIKNSNRGPRKNPLRSEESIKVWIINKKRKRMARDINALIANE